jgi:RecB family exonuclease
MRVQWLPYGQPAAEALRAAVDGAKAGEPLTPVTVVVPSNHVGVATRRRLASGALGPVGGRGVGLAAVTFLTVYRLAELLGSGVLAGHGRRPVSTPVLTAAMRAALTDDPGVFGPVADHPATELALVGAYQELRDVSAGALDRLAGTGSRARDVVRLYRAARARLRSGWYDEEDLINAAVDALESSSVPTAALGTVLVHLPQALTRHGARLLRTVSGSVEVTVLAATTGDERADGEVVRSVRRLDVPGAAPGPVVATDPMAVVGVDRTCILTTSDADEEVRAAVRSIVAAARDGVPLERVAVLYASPEPYARLVHDQLAAAGIPHNGAAVEPLTARLAGRVLLGLLALPQGGFRREDVFAWLSGARLFHHRQPVPVTAWERLSRQAGVVAGRDHWNELLTTLAAETEGEAATAAADPDTPEWRADRLREDAARARALRDFVVGLVDDLADTAALPRPWAERAAWAQRHLHDLLSAPARRGGWPVVEQKSAERVERALERLGTLDALEGAVPLDVFARTLELELEADLGRVGRMGEGVLVGSVHMGVGLDLDLVVVLGLTEGTFPAAARDDSLLPDDERRTTGDELTLRADAVERQHRHFLAALAGAERHLLCVARGDLRRSTERIPSRWVLDVAGALAGERVWGEDLLRASYPWVDNIASFDAGLRQVAFPASEQEHRLRSLLARPPRTRGRARTTGDPVLDDGMAMMAARRSNRFTRFDGNLSGLAVPSPVDRPVSATRLQTWAVCPFAYLLGSVLRVEEVENPEDRLRISALDLGSLVHEALERFVLEVLDRPADEQPRPSEPWSDADRARLREIADQRCRHYEGHGLVGRPIFWQRDRRRLLAELDRFLVRDSGYRAEHGTRPVAAELAFGMSATSPLSTALMPLPDGRTVRFRGKADRLDLSDTGKALVVDYKTGRSDSYAALSEDNPDERGTKLQLVVYGLAARLHQRDPDASVRAEFWFTSSQSKEGRVGYDVTPAVLERTTATVARMVDGIERGVFPNNPGDTSSTPSRFVSCAYCDPDALGTIDLSRRVDRKWRDAALTPYVLLVEEDVDEDADDAGLDVEVGTPHGG